MGFSTRVTKRLRFAPLVSALSLLPVLLAIETDAHAQAEAASAERADALFTEGKTLLEAHAFARACPKLAESYALDPSTGTLLALAICHEGLGRTGTAWREFRAAAESATRDGRADRARYARQRIASLEPNLSRLTILAEETAGITIDIDGAPVALNDLGHAVPIDAGRHIVTARAPGRKTWSSAVDVAPARDAQTVEVHLEPAETVSASPAAHSAALAASNENTRALGSAHDERGDDWKRPAGWIVGGLGLAGIAVGAYFGISAITKSSDAKGKCTPSLCTDAAAVAENDDAKAAATAANVSFVSGAAALGVGVYFLLTASPSAPPSASTTASYRLVPILGGKDVGAAFEGRW